MRGRELLLWCGQRMHKKEEASEKRRENSCYKKQILNCERKNCEQERAGVSSACAYIALRGVAGL